PDLDRNALSWRRGRDGLLQILRGIDLLLVELGDDVAGCDARALRRALLHDVGNQDTLRVAQTKALGELRRQGLDRDAEPTARHLAAGGELRVDPLRHVDRDREPDSHIAARAREDRAVDPDDLARHVHEWPAGIARVDGGVGLEEIVEQPLADRAALGADDA